MPERAEGRKFVDRVLGLRWDNFPERVAATYYHDHFLHGSRGEIEFGSEIKEKLLRLISKERLDLVIKAHGERT